MRNIKILSIAALASLLTSVSLSASLSGAIAQTTPMPTPTVAPINNSVTGEIVQIQGENVTIRLANGTTTVVRIPSTEITRLQLATGARIAYTPSTSGAVSGVQIVTGRTTMTTTETITTTTRPPVVTPTPIRPVVTATPVRPVVTASPVPVMSTPVAVPATRAPRALW